MDNLTGNLRAIINESTWVFAKTHAKTWQHEYVGMDKLDKRHFLYFARHIRAHGYVGKFYKKDITYFDDTIMVYWTMGAPVEKTTIINRCRKEQTYEYRLVHNDLPNNEI